MMEQDLLKRALNDLIDQGLTLTDAISAFSARESDESKRYATAARDMAVEGYIEVDENTVTSGSGDEGDYVLAWFWISDDDMKENHS